MKITSVNGVYDMFKCQCPKCGVEFEYSRKNIRLHRRWPNGFVYCPKCKAPIGHDNNNFTYNRLEKKEEEQANKAKEIAKEIESPSPLTVDQRCLFEKQVKHFTTWAALFLIFGIIFMIGGTVMFFFGKTWAVLLGFLVIGIGIAMIVVRSAVFIRIRANKLFEIERYDLQNK